MTIGERIKQRRLELNLSQDELAKKCGYKSRSSINKIELARNLPLNKIQRMATALGVTPTYLMGWDDDAEPEKDNGNMIIFDDNGEDAMEFANVIKSLNLTKEQRAEIIRYAKIIKQMEKEEKKNPSND